MPAATLNGITIEYEVHGDDGAPPLLLVMGLGGQLVGWPREFVDALAAAGPFRVIRYDNRDIGLSTKIDAPAPTRSQLLGAALSRRYATKKAAYVITDMAADGIGLLDHLGIDRAHIVGMSMGGMIAQTMAIEHPQRVRSLTSVMSNTGDRKHGRAHRKLLRHLPKFTRRGSDENQVERGVELFRLISGPHFDADATRLMVEEALGRDADVDGTARQMMAIAASPDRTPGLSRVQAPSLVIHGLVDPLVQPDGGIATARALPHSRLVMYPDMAHDLPRPRWEEIFGEITDTAAMADGGR